MIGERGACLTSEKNLHFFSNTSIPQVPVSAGTEYSLRIVLTYGICLSFFSLVDAWGLIYDFICNQHKC